MNDSIQEKNYREQYALEDGDIIRCKDAEYTIVGNPIGYGGSSILYAAKKSDTDILFAIKEWFPNDNCTKFKRTNGVIQPINWDDGMAIAQMERARENLKNETRIGQHLFNTNTRTIPTWSILIPVSITAGGETHTKIAAGIFSVQPRFDTKAKSLEDILAEISAGYTPKERRKTRGLPNIHLTACLMEEVLRALQQIHDARDPEDPHMQGYYYGDLHPKNVFFAESDLSKDYVGIAHLLDYGSSMVLDHNGETKELKPSDIFSTDGFRPPEIRDQSGQSLRLGKQADVYSAGCLLYRCVVSKAKFEMAEKSVSPILGPAVLSEIDGKTIGCSGSALTLLNSILDRATKENPRERYPSIAKLLEEIQTLKQCTEPPKYLLPTNLSSPEYFVPHSRDEEIATIAKSVGDGETVFLHGIGGIGKTECAIQLAKYLNPPRGAYLVHFQGSMRETILKMDFSGYEFDSTQKTLRQEEVEEAEYRDRLEKLKEHYQDTVLIIDNFDVPGKTLDDLRREPAFNDFLGLNLKRIFTTRYPVGRNDWEIRELSEAALLELMRYYCTDSSITDEQYLSILKEIQNHTLTAMLIAKTLEESWGDVTPEMILEALRRGKLSHDEYPEVVSDQNRGYQQKQIYEHLKVLFDLSGMNVYDRTVLCWATLIPHAGIDAKLFRSCLESDEKKALEQLVKRGWLIRTESILKIHPVIREVCRNELINIDKDRDNNLRFLNMLLCNAEKMQYEPNTAMDYTAKKMRQVVAVCEEAAQRIGIVHITEDYWKKINNLLKVIGNHHLCKQIKSFYPSVGQTRIPYAENNRTNGMRSFILDESNNVQYTVGTIGVKDNSEILVKILATTSSVSGNQQLKTVYISLDEMCEASCVFVFAFHKDIQVMYRYVGYFSPMGVMLNPTPLRVPRVFVYNQGNDRKTMVRVVEFSIHEVSADLFGGRTVEEAEGEFEGKVILVDPNNAESILLSGSEIQVESQYYADFIFLKQDGISFMH